MRRFSVQADNRLWHQLIPLMVVGSSLWRETSWIEDKSYLNSTSVALDQAECDEVALLVMEHNLMQGFHDDDLWFLPLDNRDTLTLQQYMEL